MKSEVIDLKSDEAVCRNAIQALHQSLAEKAIVDFDETLFLANSTELFLDTIAPRAASYVVDKCICYAFDLLVWNPDSRYQYRDQVRLLIAIALFPWSVHFWRKNSAILHERYINFELLSRLQEFGSERVTVLTLGFREIVTPLLMYTLPKSRLLASSIYRPWLNVRLHGKRLTLERAGIELDDNCYIISDSKSDADLLASTNNGHLVKWDIPKHASVPVYVPFRYTAEGKYPGTNTIIRQQFGEDLVVALLSIQTSMLNMACLPLMFVSFYAVYEIGYFKNDRIAAKVEGRPIVSGGSSQFDDWTISRYAWGYAFIASLLLSPIVGLNIAIAWLCILVVVQLSFEFYNRLAPTARIVPYFWLQVLKYGSFAAVVGATPIGIALICSQIAKMCIPYVLYRLKGLRDVPRTQMFRFCVLAMIIFSDQIFNWPLKIGESPFSTTCLILAWSVLKVLEEELGSLYVCLRLRLARACKWVLRLFHRGWIPQ